MQNLKKKQLIVKKYIEESYKVNIRSWYVEDNPQRVSRYINGLRFEIQDEMNLLCPSFVEQAYYFTFKVEEKLARKSQEKT